VARAGDAAAVARVLAEAFAEFRRQYTDGGYRATTAPEAVIRARLAEGPTWRERGCKRLYLSTTPFLHSAIRLYERCGFRRTDEGPHDLFGTPLFTMEKGVSAGDADGS